MLGHDWQPAEGTCVDDDWSTHESGRWVMDIRPLDGSAPFRQEVHHPGGGSDFRGPMRGQVCKMLVDVKKQKAKFDTTDLTLSWKAHRQAEQLRLQAELNGASGSAALPGVGYQLGAGSSVRVTGADAAPLLEALLGGNPHAQRAAALRAMREARQNPGGLMGAFAEQARAAQAQAEAMRAQGLAAPAQDAPAPAPFGAAPTPAPFSAGPAGPATPNVARFDNTPVPASFGGDPIPASFGGPTMESSTDLAGRIAKLQALHNQGLLSKSEFEAQRKRILDSI